MPAGILYVLSDFLRYALKTLSERKLRSILTIIGIAIGPIAMVSISSVVAGYSDYVIKSIEGLGQNLVVVFPTAKYELKQDDLEYIRSLPGVYRAEPFYALRGKVQRGVDEVDVQVYFVDITILFDALKGLKIEKGTLPSPSEYTRAVVGHLIAFDEQGDQYYDLGDVITIKTTRITSEGELREEKINVIVEAILAEFGNAFVINPDQTVFLPLNAGKTLAGLKKWDGILVVAEDPAYVDNITRTLRDAYLDKANIVSLIEIARVVASITAAMNFVTYATSLAAFAVAATGVAATMITSVIERTREIGVLKAIGFTNREVVLMIMLEALVMSLLGAVIGIALGALGAHMLSQKGMVIRGAHTFVIKAPPMITVELIARTLVLTTVIGVLGSIIPAYQAARIPPATALRYE